eukprot:scaffold54528_cov44-Prasinocladus_malaysianus.AAC.1
MGLADLAWDFGVLFVGLGVDDAGQPLVKPGVARGGPQGVHHRSLLLGVILFGHPSDHRLQHLRPSVANDRPNDLLLLLHGKVLVEQRPELGLLRTDMHLEVGSDSGARHPQPAGKGCQHVKVVLLSSDLAQNGVDLMVKPHSIISCEM